MYVMPQPHKCIKCEHEFNFSPHNYNIAPMTSEKEPVCPKCWDEFLTSIGIGYGTTVWTKDGSAYEQKRRETPKMRKATREEKISRPGIYEVPSE
jgi:NAD-dependent SIR2 family protein deacetylase